MENAKNMSETELKECAMQYQREYQKQYRAQNRERVEEWRKHQTLNHYKRIVSENPELFISREDIADHE